MMTASIEHPKGPLGRPVLLVGSIPLANARAVFSLAGEMLGGHLQAAPDGETGRRTNWIAWQREVMRAAPFLKEEPIDAWLGDAGRQSQFALHGEAAADARFGPLGYAAAAKASYAEFKRLREAGVLPAHMRFQVSLPTPEAPIVAFVRPSDADAVAPAYARAMREEVAEIRAAIPAGDLALQWDVALEIAALEGLRGPVPEIETVAARLADLGGWAPEGARLGYHFCYGDAGHKHFKEPGSTALMTRLANALFASATRGIDYIHMPVPRSRLDDAYFSPLRDLQPPAGCQLYLGLIHRTDGLAGAASRIAAAETFVTGFGVATECGWGRRSPETIADLMRLSVEVAAL